MRQMWIVVIALLVCSLTGFAGQYFYNDTGMAATGLQITFPVPVKIIGFGDILKIVEPQGVATTFVFSGATVPPSKGEWVDWAPKDVKVNKYKWIVPQESPQTRTPYSGGETHSDELTPDVYIYVPRIVYSPQEKKCLDCKTFVIVAAMRYFGDDISFEDICREVGHPFAPGEVSPEEGSKFFQGLIHFARAHGFIVNSHFWDVDDILQAVKAGHIVIADHHVGDMPAEPGIIKGFNGSHIWVWGIWEYILQRNLDTVYTYKEFSSLLYREGKTGMSGYIPWLWPSPRNCLEIYKTGEPTPTSTYPIEAIPYATALERSQSGGPGTVHVTNLSGDGKLSWSSPLRVEEAQEIHVYVYNATYITNTGGSPTVLFAVRFLPGSNDAGSVIVGYGAREKHIWKNAFGYPFEQITLPVVASGNAWIGKVTIRPTVSVESLYVLAPPGPNRAFFSYEVRVQSSH